ncbi:receptor-type tyrosine-protein phosphatase O isoform X2 [Microcaecilia unicolor]|uniref:Receptor-type tyrosine-protein phosphatase O isoform X2 n=1 Tax=Microcaecilia unicolor TaxID=1415580 RepID=A0A6P7Z1J6_9AMPH|nr:receptor-type tyrosine-protein phosphatase O isoform X2 [Microcaecilia unicolor]
MEAASCRLLSLLWLFSCFQYATMFLVIVHDDNSLEISLEVSDMLGPSSVYRVKITGEPTSEFLQFRETNGTLPPPITFNASYHGLHYLITLLALNMDMVPRAVKSVMVLTRPLPVYNVSIYDYKPSPETGVVFEIQYPQKNNVFTRVNISYWEGGDFRSTLYTGEDSETSSALNTGVMVLKHWMPGVCYSNITVQLLSQTSFNRTSLVQSSGVQHDPRYHRTVPHPPRNVSLRIVSVERGTLLGMDVEILKEAGQPPSQDPIMREDSIDFSGDQPDSAMTSMNSIRCMRDETIPWSYNETEGIVNRTAADYEDMLRACPPVTPSPATLTPVRMLLSWLPPRPPTAFDGFSVCIQREGSTTQCSRVNEHTLEFVTILRGPGKFTLSVVTFSSSGSCETRESQSSKPSSFYISPSGELFEELNEKPKEVTVRVLNSSTASVSWKCPQVNCTAAIVSVVSLTCQKESQQLERDFCTQVNLSTSVIENLVPGAQYQVVVYLQRGPLVGPPSNPLTFVIRPTGIIDLALYPLSPNALILSWSRPHREVLQKYLVEMFYFDPSTLLSQWTPYYEITSTRSRTVSVRITDLRPAWFYSFRVNMITWGIPELRCCDTPTVSLITAPLSPEISTVEYFNNLLYVSWTYGEEASDFTHSRMLHWELVAEGRKKVKKNVMRNLMTAVLSLPPGDIYNLTVTACSEGRSNTSAARLVLLDPVPPKSLFTVNKTQTSVTLLWLEEGVVDYFYVSCWLLDSRQEESVTVSYHIVTVSGLQPDSSYNCSVSSISHQTRSAPAFITVSTLGVELNANVVVISVLALLSILLIGLLVITLVVLRRKHLQMARECGAGTFVNFASLERDGKLPYNWRRSIFAFLTLLPSCLWTDYLLAFYINPWNKNGIKKRKLTNPVQLDDFDVYLKEMAKDSSYKFSLQFEELKQIGIDITHTASDLPSNRCKNRYTNILPYDFSRVRLVSMSQEEGTDYINANYIPGYNSPQEYIATQGPLPETRGDFWKMVLQQKSQIIVMLTQCNEKRRVKCDHYWPFTAEPVLYGDITVAMISENEQTDWCYRTFRISCADEVLEVMHFNYTSWPDHGVPSTNAAESVLHFVQMIRKQANKSHGPLTVHCSAGVGRTGTFISLDRLMQHIQDHEFIDILGLVSELRSYRMSMVQTEEQYIFIHQCVQLIWKKKQQQFCISDVIYENVSM